MTRLLSIYKHLKPLSTLGFSIIVVALLGACRSVAPSAIASESEALPVKLAAVESAMIRDTSEFIANLESRKSVNLQPRVQGQISRIFVRAGDTVKAGTPIMQIDAAQQQAAVSASIAAVDSAQAELDNARATLNTYQAERLEKVANLNFNRQQYQRFANLHTNGAISRQALDQYQNSLAGAKASLRVIDAQIEAQKAVIARTERAVRQAQANTQQQQVQLQYFAITAPFDGTVGDIPVKVGSFVDSATRLATVTENKVLEVNISIPVNRSQDIRVGTPIELTDAQGKVIGISRVSFIAPNVANNMQSVLTKARLDNPKRQLRADEFVSARVIWEKRPGVTVPSIAISRVAGQNFVFVAKQGEAELVVRQRPVKLGNIEGNNYQVLEGLKPGERIAVTGLLQLSDGAAITPKS